MAILCKRCFRNIFYYKTIGDTTAVCSGGLDRKIKDEELSGSLACDGYVSALAGVFGSTPVTSLSENVGLVNLTKVINRKVIIAAGAILVTVSFFPFISEIINTIPSSVLGGCTIIIFGQILMSGIKMIYESGFNTRNITIASISLSIGVGFTSSKKIFQFMPKIIKEIFSNSIVANVFVIAVLLDLLLPKKKEKQ